MSGVRTQQPFGESRPGTSFSNLQDPSRCGPQLGVVRLTFEWRYSALRRDSSDTRRLVTTIIKGPSGFCGCREDCANCRLEPIAMFL